MLKSHFDAIENYLLAISKIPSHSGHPLHKGTPREAFIKEFLSSHLSERVAIGTGEIIDANSKPKEKRNQIDIIIYRRDYPKIHFGGGIFGFLAESVVATIEVKSILKKGELKKAIYSANVLKKLQRKVTTSISSGYHPPSILSYIIAYSGPKDMKTVYTWIPDIYNSLDITYPEMGVKMEDRIKVISPSIDGLFVLGKGFIQFDNFPFGFLTDEIRAMNPNVRWTIANTPNSNLLLFFIILTVAISGMSFSFLNPASYLSNFSIPTNNLYRGE